MENKVQTFLENKLKLSNYELTDYDRKSLDHRGLEEFIFSKLTSKKFRRSKLDEQIIQKLKSVIELKVSKKKPLELTFPFGAYKPWRLPSNPEVDWAEFFFISFVRDRLLPIVSVYEPGIVFYFSSDGVIVPQLDNTPVSDVLAYEKSFLRLLFLFEEKFPRNFKMQFVRVKDFYEPEEFQTALKGSIKDLNRIWSDEYTKEEKEAKQKRSRNNFQWDGKEDFTRLNTEEREKKIEEAAILHDAYCQLPKRRDFVRGEDKITVFCDKVPNAIHIATCKTSSVYFWVGFGILEKVKGSFMPRILTYKQLEYVKRLNPKMIDVNLVPLKNFKTIQVCDGPLTF